MCGVYDTAERFMAEALQIRRELGDPRSIALSLNNLGIVYQDSGRFAEAKACFDEALILRREIGDRPGLAQTLNNLGTVHQDNGDNETAIALWKEALDLAREVGDRMRQSVILTNIGEAHYRLGRPAEAIKVLKQAEEISATLGDRILQGEIHRALGKAHMLVHDYAAAREQVARSIALFEQARGKPFLGVALRTLGEITAAGAFGGEDHVRAREAFARSIQLFEELGNELELARSCQAYADFLLRTDPDGPGAADAAALRARADSILDKLRASDDALPPLPGERTVPGVVG
jgi:tetratricopeptide (TPR) repeat protein